MHEKGIICKNINELKKILGSIKPLINIKPNGQLNYHFSDGLVLDVYTTTNKVVFQGQNPRGKIAQQIDHIINQINNK